MGTADMLGPKEDCIMKPLGEFLGLQNEEQYIYIYLLCYFIYNLQNRDDFDQFNLHSENLRKSLLRDCVRKWNALDKTK